MEFIDERLSEYCLDHSDAEDLVLSELSRETHLKVLSPRMLSGHLQGMLLKQLSQLVNPYFILEIGTYTGYSAICLARGLKPGGKLLTIDINEETESIARKYFAKAGLENAIDFKIGDAKNIIPSITDTFDLVFIDADKRNYSLYYDLVFEKVRSGGLIIADNVLWSGKVLDPTSNTDGDTKAIIEFNKKVKDDFRVEKMMLPLRDGLFVIRKK